MSTLIDPALLIFGQPHAASARWFAMHTDPGGSTLPIERFPHRLALDGNTGAYIDYLAASWGPKNPTDTELGHRLARFFRVADSIEQDGVQSPITVVPRRDGRYIVAHGNHRASVSHHLGRLVPAEIVHPIAWAERIVTNPARYGTGRNGTPYQEVPGLLGGRRFLDARNQAIDPDDLSGAVLDLGCNLGSATRASAITATLAYGVDNDPRLITAALRLGVWFDSPARYGVADLAKESPTIHGVRWDTILCFAVAAHVPADPLWESLRRGQVVYIEANQRAGSVADRPTILDRFTHVEPVAVLPRVMWRCVP